MRDDRIEGTIPDCDEKRRAAAVLDVLRNQLPPEDACRKHGVGLHELAGWVFLFMEGGLSALQAGKVDLDP